MSGWAPGWGTLVTTATVTTGKMIRTGPSSVTPVQLQEANVLHFKGALRLSTPMVTPTGDLKSKREAT